MIYVACPKCGKFVFRAESGQQFDFQFIEICGDNWIECMGVGLITKKHKCKKKKEIKDEKDF
jgi:hypothetical protein